MLKLIALLEQSQQCVGQETSTLLRIFIGGLVNPARSDQDTAFSDDILIGANRPRYWSTL